MEAPWLGEQPCPIPGHLEQGTLVWAVVLWRSPLQYGTWQEGPYRATGLSPELSESFQCTCYLQAHKISSLSLCWFQDWNPGPLGNLPRIGNPACGGMGPWARALVFCGVAQSLLTPSCPECIGHGISPTVFSPFPIAWCAQQPSSSALFCVALPQPPGPWPTAVAVLTSCGAHVRLLSFPSEWLSFYFTKECSLWNIFVNQEVPPKTSWKIPHYFRNITVLPLTQHFV